MGRTLITPEKGETRFLFFSGKGGVGKSTMSSATAVWLARQGFKTLLVTTDPAPNLSDIFGQEIGHRITPINGVENLYAMEIDPDKASEEYRERSIAPMKDLLDEKTLGVIKEQLDSPCVEEVAAFDRFIEFMDDPEYDVVVFDTAPTGHTIRLLELPSGWSTELERGGSTCIGPAASLQEQKTRYEKAVSYLQDSGKTTFIFVLRPENSSLEETLRSTKELTPLGIKPGLHIVNGLLPEYACTDDFFKKRKAREDEVIEKIHRALNGEKIFFELMDSEVRDIELLDEIGRTLYDGAAMSKQKKTGMNLEDGEPDLNYDSKDVLSLFEPLKGTRYLFFTGKGGVGKSTLAGAAALFLADSGYKTLIVSTDPASHLQGLFEQEVGHEPTKINGADRLYASRIDQEQALEEYRGRILEALADLDDDSKGSVIEDLNSPCAEEMAAFEHFMSYFSLKEYDIIIFDTAPTGHTLRLLELPSDWKGYIDLGTLSKKTSAEAGEKYTGVIDTLKDHDKTTFVFVTFPEHTPIIEAWRASQELKKQVGIETGAVAVNYLLPRDVGKNAFFRNRRVQQNRYMADIRDRFNTPLIYATLMDHEPAGLNDLRELGQEVFGG